MWLSTPWLVVNPVVTAMISAPMMKAPGTLIHSMHRHTHTHTHTHTCTHTHSSVSLLTSLIPLWERGISRRDWTGIRVCVCVCVCVCERLCVAVVSLPTNIVMYRTGIWGKKARAPLNCTWHFILFFPRFPPRYPRPAVLSFIFSSSLTAVIKPLWLS